MSPNADWAELSEQEAALVGSALDASLVAIPPPLDALPALLRAVANPWGRFLDAFAGLVDLPRAAAQAILDRAEAGRGWEPGPLPGLTVVHFEGGPRTVGADVGLVRLGPGALHPHHDHLGEEAILVLSGGYADSAGFVVEPGYAERRGFGEAHHLVAGPEGVVFAIVLREGVAFHDPNGGPPLVVKAGG